MVADKNRFNGMVKKAILSLCICLVSGFNADAQLIELVTEQGSIKIRLYKDTPIHTANFLKNVKDGKYNGVLFHRVIKDFMIQTGDIQSVNAKPGQLLGGETVKNTVKAEILPNHYHKKGALAAARQPDQTNPQRASSPYQFYIVSGRLYTKAMLRTLENNQNRPQRYKVADSLLHVRNNTLAKKQLDSCMNIKDYKTADVILDQMRTETDSIIGEKKLLKFTDQQIIDYTTVGGVPNLDGKYTVFGEVEEGFDVITLIGGYETDNNNRPKNDVRILKAIVLEE